MNKSAAAVIAVFVATCVAPRVVGQTTSESPSTLSTWSIHTPDTPVADRSPYPVGVLTPSKAIVVRRLEAISNKGPSAGARASGEPISCPVQYWLELTNGVVTQTIPISNNFLHKKTSQTYTDSGPLSLSFSPGNRILLSMVAPKPQFPPVSCAIIGLDITIQYELADEAAQKTPSTGDGQ